jgi:hypothetical protein
MSFDKPPTLGDFNEMIPKPRQEITPIQKRLRILIAVLAILVLILGLVNLITSGLTRPLSAAGSVIGVALDAQGQPFEANISVEGTALIARANPDGSFQLKDIPAGRYLLVVANSSAGREFPIVVIPWQTTDLGKLQLVSTPTP